MYSAMVKTQENDLIRVDSEYNTKTDFIKDLRSNGYKVNADKVKTFEEMERILNTTNCNPWDWNPKKYK
jgi:hypothetical protein